MENHQKLYELQHGQELVDMTKEILENLESDVKKRTREFAC